MSRASQFLTVSAELAASTIIQGVSNATKFAADGVSNVTSHLFPHSYDDSDNRSQFNKWASFASFLVTTLGSELMIFAKLKKNHAEKGFDNFVRGHIVPTVGSLVPALATTLMLYSIGDPDKLNMDNIVFAGVTGFSFNLAMIDCSILYRAISNIRNPIVDSSSLDVNDLDENLTLTPESKPDTRREKIVLGLILTGWALAMGTGAGVKYAEGDEAHPLDSVAAAVGISVFKRRVSIFYSR